MIRTRNGIGQRWGAEAFELNWNEGRWNWDIARSIVDGGRSIDYNLRVRPTLIGLAYGR